MATKPWAVNRKRLTTDIHSYFFICTSANVTRFIPRSISSFHGGDYDDYCRLVCDAVKSRRTPRKRFGGTRYPHLYGTLRT